MHVNMYYSMYVADYVAILSNMQLHEIQDIYTGVAVSYAFCLCYG